MKTSGRHPSRVLVAGGAAATIVILCALWLRGAADDPSPPEARSPAASAPAAARGPSPGSARGEPRSDEDEGAEDEAPASRRDEYAAAFDRKIDRIKTRIAEDCAEEDEALSHALDDFDDVRDRIVDSAVLTDQGLKTKAEQQELERKELLAYDTKVCQEVARRSPGARCMRHFRACDEILRQRSTTGAR